MSTPDHAFTFIGRFPVFNNRISSMIHVSPSRDTSLMQLKVRALWDTGATFSIISKRLADRLNMTMSDSKHVLMSALGFKTEVADSETWITVVLGSFPIRLRVNVLDNLCADENVDVVLGMDFITKGDFMISNDGGQVMFSFSYPANFPINYHDCLTKLNIPHAHFEDENADGDVINYKGIENIRSKQNKESM